MPYVVYKGTIKICVLFKKTNNNVIFYDCFAIICRVLLFDLFFMCGLI